MSKKIMLLALTAISAALFALPAVASAGTWHFEPASNFTIAGGAATLETTVGFAVNCTSSSGSGSYDAGSTTTGKITLTFHGCKGPLGVTCSSCATAGTITTLGLSFHNIQITGGSNATPGVLITPNNVTNEPTAGDGPFATFVCFGVTTTVNGNGIIGHVEKNAAGESLCGKTTKTLSLNFQKTVAGHQLYKQVTGSGTIYNLKSKNHPNGAWDTASQVGTGTVTAEKEGKVNCT